MGTSKRRNARPPPQLRSRTTRSRGKALADPAENTQLLTEQLRALGLYAAPTLGDGNCLFRALSDQLYGTPSYHLKLRKDVCDWIENHKERYAPFVDDERGLEVHLQCMRQQATYGGHLELSAFAHMTKRNVKVIQPGLVYVIEWDAGGDISADPPPSPATSNATFILPDTNSDDREKRMTRRERIKAERERTVLQPPTPDPSRGEDEPLGPVYVAYHDWEHFSSIRSLKGPHSGLPNVHECPAPDEGSPTVSPVRKRPASKSFSKPVPKTRAKSDSKHSTGLLASVSEPTPLTPSLVPLPVSRSPSPSPDPSSSVVPPTYPLPATPSNLSRIYRSPKRTFDESSASSESSQSVAKRLRGSSRPPLESSVMDSKLSSSIDLEEAEIDTPPLMFSAPGSPSPSISSLSSLSSPEATPPPTTPTERPLTRRQRKKLGLPAPRTALVASTRASAGKIVIPGGRMKRGSGVGVAGEKGEDSEEWQKNGTGRVDVRGFRELKI